MANVFTQRFRARESIKGTGRSVLLWPDTFNHDFMPHTAHAATKVLEAMGYEVRVPTRPLCCGRPLYDFGMLDLAKRQLRQILKHLTHEIRAGTPVVAHSNQVVQLCFVMHW